MGPQPLDRQATATRDSNKQRAPRSSFRPVTVFMWTSQSVLLSKWELARGSFNTNVYAFDTFSSQT